MARQKKSGQQKEKKTPVRLSPIPRKHGGKVTEPWETMVRLIDEMAASDPHRFGHLQKCKIRLYWVKDWKADADGIAVGAQVCKANELDRLLVEDSKGEAPDIFVKLPREQWQHLDQTERHHRLYHEQCHIPPSLDGNGNQKRDTKDRLLWRLGRHPIAAFPEEISRFGVDRVVGHNAAIVQSAESAARPMFKVFDAAEQKAKGKITEKKDAWRRWGIAKLELDLAVEDYVVKAGLDTIGALSDFMAKHGDFWDKDLRVGGESKPRNLRAKVDAAYARFWQQHPEFCT